MTQLLPLPLDAGPKIRAYYVLRHLAAAGHDVTLLSFVRPTDRQSDVRALAEFCTTVETVPIARSRMRDVRDGLHSLVTTTPFLILRDQMREMTERMSRLAGQRRFDAVHADQLWMAPYAVDSAIPLKVLDQHNAVFKVPERLAENQRNPLAKALLRREASKLASFERSTCDQFNRVVWVSEEDRDAFPARVNGGSNAIIPIAVDPTARAPLQRPRPFRVTFLGGIHWPPNAEGVRWFAEQAWPAVAAAIPDCVFTVVGKGALGRLGSDELQARIDVTGYVDNPDRYLTETAVFVVPLLTGAGMRVKILDAWSWGLPLVSTTIGAEGVKARDGENLLIADDGARFAESVIRILRDRQLADRLSDNGRATVEAFYDWRKIYRAWDQVYG